MASVFDNDFGYEPITIEYLKKNRWAWTPKEPSHWWLKYVNYFDNWKNEVVTTYDVEFTGDGGVILTISQEWTYGEIKMPTRKLATIRNASLFDLEIVSSFDYVSKSFRNYYRDYKK